MSGSKMEFLLSLITQLSLGWLLEPPYTFKLGLRVEAKSQSSMPGKDVPDHPSSLGVQTAPEGFLTSLLLIGLIRP